MKKISKLIILMTILMIITIIIIVVIRGKRDVNNEGNIIKIDEIEELATRNEKLHIETSRNRFYVVKNCIEQFYLYYQKLNPENLDIKLGFDETSFANITKRYEEKIYAMLDKEYISYKNITSDNISEKLGEIGKTEVFVDKVYTKDLDSSSYICFVEGRTKEENSNIKQFKMVVRLNGTNSFKIFLEDYLIEKNLSDFSKEIPITQLCNTEITNEKYNTYQNRAISSKDYINDLFDQYISTVINDQEYAYQLVDENYQKVRFENLEEYKTYVKENRAQMAMIRLDSFNTTTKNGVNEYLCKDNYGNYYRFKETAPFQYTVILDNYTIPMDDFIKEYKDSSDVEKVILNIKRFFMGIDDKNYGYSYRVLSELFKSSNYPTKNDFIKYAKQNFFEENKIEYIRYEAENGIYAYKIKLTDATGNSQEERTFSILVRLNNGTDFELSFSKE